MTTVKVTTKKLLVAYDPSDPEATSSDFLVPMIDGAGVFLQGLKSKATSVQGMMVYIGTSIGVSDLVVKLVESGRRFENVGRTLQALEAYLQMLQEYKIGNILVVEPCNSHACGFCLRKLADHPPVKPFNQP